MAPFVIQKQRSVRHPRSTSTTGRHSPRKPQPTDFYHNRKFGQGHEAAAPLRVANYDRNDNNNNNNNDHDDNDTSSTPPPYPYPGNDYKNFPIGSLLNIEFAGGTWKKGRVVDTSKETAVEVYVRYVEDNTHGWYNMASVMARIPKLKSGKSLQQWTDLVPGPFPKLPAKQKDTQLFRDGPRLKNKRLRDAGVGQYIDIFWNNDCEKNYHPAKVLHRKTIRGMILVAIKDKEWGLGWLNPKHWHIRNDGHDQDRELSLEFKQRYYELGPAPKRNRK